MRKVKFKKWIPREYEQREGFKAKQPVRGTGIFESDFISKGVFHSWGVNYEESTEGFGNYTIGLIELPDGTVIEVIPQNIKFIK